MIAFFAGSRLPIKDILKQAEALDALAIGAGCAQSWEELELAHHLAAKTHAGGHPIAKKLKYEFLLWLTGKTDIRSAMEKSVPLDSGKFLIVMFKGDKAQVLDALEAIEVPGKLEEKAGSLRLEEMSLSRIKN